MNSDPLPSDSLSMDALATPAMELMSPEAMQAQLQKTQNDLEIANQAVRDLAKQRRQSIGLFRGTGYILLLITLILYINALIPFAPMNPAWQLSVMGTWVQNMAFPILGFTLIFYGGPEGRLKREGLLVKLLSFATLLMALLFFLLLPLGLSATNRLYNQSKTQLGQGLDQQLNVLQQIETRMSAAGSNDQILSVIQQIQPNVQAANVPNPQQAKREVLGQLNQARTTLRTNVQQQEQQQQFGLIKGFLQQALLAAVTVAIFVRLWWITRWARIGF
jgi:hypothetical protein